MATRLMLSHQAPSCGGFIPAECANGFNVFFSLFFFYLYFIIPPPPSPPLLLSNAVNTAVGPQLVSGGSLQSPVRPLARETKHEGTRDATLTQAEIRVQGAHDLRVLLRKAAEERGGECLCVCTRRGEGGGVPIYLIKLLPVQIWIRC